MKKLVVIAIAAAIALSVAGLAYASESIWGRVTSVDMAASSIMMWNGITGKYTLKVDPSTTITQDGKAIKLADIKVPSMITGEADKQADGSYLAKKLIVTACSFTGVGGRVNSVDTATSTVKMWSKKLGEFSVKFTADAKITKDGKLVQLSDIKVGDMIKFDATKQADGTYLAKMAEINPSNGGGCGGGGCRGGCGKGKNKRP